MLPKHSQIIFRMATKLSLEKRGQSPVKCFSKLHENSEMKTRRQRHWVRGRLHLWIIMFNTLEASVLQLLPLHKSHASGGALPRCWTPVAAKNILPAAWLGPDSKTRIPHTSSFITAHVDLWLIVLFVRPPLIRVNEYQC